ncbi:hypothetical protein D9T14_03930 [Propionibacterium australiense]|uniref:Uncharacterized protein n=1 Tax=Propionibacterium australiense TaxID=119981 RepID=A0A8B3FIQ2_9ACTN|nr:hypothetical protein D7U36_08675 [Propionibacterium australiense]RLP11804.1 hypothetical protein D9T14_03930 [Propionibacterium australiense]
MSVEAFPLLPTDPPKIGDFWIDARLTATEAGVAYLAHSDAEHQVMLIILAAGAAGDAAARDRLAGEVNKMSADTVVARGGQDQDEGRLGHLFRSEDDDPVGPDHAPLAPWVALVWDGSTHALAEADRLLRSVDLSASPQLGPSRGPGFSIPWSSDTRPGAWRLWPLPWPGRRDRAGWVPVLASWLLMLLLASTALLITVLLFQNQPPESPQAPVTGSASSSSESSESSGSGSPSESDESSPGSPSESDESSSGSPSESDSSASGGSSDTPGNDGSPTKTPSMNVSGSGTATATDEPTQQQTRL